MEAKYVLGNKPSETNTNRHRICPEDKGRGGVGGADSATQRSRMGEQRQHLDADHPDRAGPRVATGSPPPSAQADWVVEGTESGAGQTEDPRVVKEAGGGAPPCQETRDHRSRAQVTPVAIPHPRKALLRPSYLPSFTHLFIQHVFFEHPLSVGD